MKFSCKITRSDLIKTYLLSVSLFNFFEKDKKIGLHLFGNYYACSECSRPELIIRVTKLLIKILFTLL